MLPAVEAAAKRHDRYKGSTFGVWKGNKHTGKGTMDLTLLDIWDVAREVKL